MTDISAPPKTVVCPNGHHRKFFVSYTAVAGKCVEDEDGVQHYKHLNYPEGSITLFYCADCGAVLVKEVDGYGKPVIDE